MNWFKGLTLNVASVEKRDPLTWILNSNEMVWLVSHSDAALSLYSVADLDAGLEHEQRLFQQVVTQQMERRLTEAKASILNCQALLLPRHMTTRISQDVVRASADEPCGLRGASIKLYIDGKDGLKYIGSIFPDSSVTPTFELSVVFKAESDGWPSFKNIFDGNKVLKLRPEYRLVKRKLYSSASPVVHDFN